MGLNLKRRCNILTNEFFFFFLLDLMTHWPRKSADFEEFMAGVKNMRQTGILP